MTNLKYSYENLLIKKDLIKLRQKWQKILKANISLDIIFDEQKGIIKFGIEVKE